MNPTSLILTFAWIAILGLSFTILSDLAFGLFLEPGENYQTT